jgi:glycine betaine/proline transport system ATP-binding protein
MSDPQTSPDPVLEMRDVTAGAMRDLHAVVLQGANWSVARGDFWVVGGLQGAGKTDFIFLAAGLMGPSSGSYRFMGEEMPIFEDDRLQARLKLGMVFDGGQLLNHLTVSENIALPLRYHRNLGASEGKEEVQRMLELTDLAQWADSTPGAIGRNWQQRVGLARALMLRPEVLLLDNPLAGLDLRHRNWWLKCITDLSAGHEWMEKKPVTLVVTSDDLRPWRKRAKQFAMLKDKQLVVLGSWDQLEKVTDDNVQELLSAASQAS